MGPGRAFTYVDGSRVASQNPGYCFKCAGWRRVGVSATGKHLLERCYAIDETARHDVVDRSLAAEHGVVDLSLEAGRLPEPP
jgi:hypothetical protein